MKAKASSVCLSLYADDILRLKRLVRTASRTAHTKPSKSAVIRQALYVLEQSWAKEGLL